VEGETDAEKSGVCCFRFDAEAEKTERLKKEHKEDIFVQDNTEAPLPVPGVTVVDTDIFFPDNTEAPLPDKTALKLKEDTIVPVPGVTVVDKTALKLDNTEAPLPVPGVTVVKEDTIVPDNTEAPLPETAVPVGKEDTIVPETAVPVGFFTTMTRTIRSLLPL